MTHGNRDNDHLLVLEAADNAVVADSVSPMALEVMTKSMPKHPGVLKRNHALFEMRDNLALSLSIKRTKVSFEAPVEPNRPGQTSS